MKLLVAIPCFNEAQNLPAVLQKIPKSVQGFESVTVLVVDDGSHDGSAQVASAQGAIVEALPRNRGVGVVFQHAVRYMLTHDYDVMVNMDGDGQFDANDIPRLVAPIVAHEADFVTASRFLEARDIPHMSTIKRWGNARMSRLISGLVGQSFTDVSCGFRAYSRETLMRLNLQGQFTYTQESFLNLVFKNLTIAEVAIRVIYFPDRQSRVASSIFRYFINTAMIIFRTYRDYRPLRFFWTLSAACGVVGVGFLSFLFAWWLCHQRLSPHIWSGFVGGSFCFAALAFFITGLLADMLDRMRNYQEELLYLARRGSEP